MYLYQLDTEAHKHLSVSGLCRVIINDYHPSIIETCDELMQFLQEHEQFAELPKSVSELVHIIFYELNREIGKYMDKEKRNILPQIKEALLEGSVPFKEEEVLEFKETHVLLLSIVQRLRQLMFNYVKQPGWTQEFKACVTGFFTLENKIYKWINVEENYLYPQLEKIKANERFLACVSLV